MKIDRNRISGLLESPATAFGDQPEAVIGHRSSVNRKPKTDHVNVHARKRSFWPWPGLIFVMLGVNVAIVSITIFYATTDRSFAVEPDYYRKAMTWDELAAQRTLNDELGWMIDVPESVSGQPISVSLHDRDGESITAAEVRMTAFHHAFAHTRLETILDEISPGLYRSGESLTRPGTWEIRLTVNVREQTFTAVLRHLVREKESLP